MTLRSFLRRRPLVSYFVLAYACTWSAITLAGVATRFQGIALPPERLPLVMLAMLLGPSIAGIVMTAVVGGRAGLQHLGIRMRRWRVAPRWYAVALLTNPLVTLTVLLSLTAFVSPDYAPGFNLLFGLIAGGLAGFCEEIGWTGFATPRLRERYGVLRGGLLLGILWGAWHLLAGFAFSTPGQELFWLGDAALYWLAALTAYRVLMTWVYSQTGSVLVAQLMHLAFTGTFVTVQPALAPQQTLAYDLVIAGALWTLVGLLALALNRPARMALPSR
jgi:membrane protease YdiL (CAAX protease family)